MTETLPACCAAGFTHKMLSLNVFNATAGHFVHNGLICSADGGFSVGAFLQWDSQERGELPPVLSCRLLNREASRCELSVEK